VNLKRISKDLKAKMRSWALITASSRKAINNWRESFKIDKNQVGRDCPKKRFGRMFTITLFIS